MRKPAYYCPKCEECVGYVGRFFAFLFGNQFHRCRRKHMPVNLDSLASKVATIATDVTKLSAELQNAAALQAQNDQLKAENATLQASLDAASAADAASQTQASTIEAQADATIATLSAIPSTAPAPAPVA